MNTDSQIKVAVLLGGTSPERDVSLISGKYVVQGLREAGYIVKPIDPALGAVQPENEDELFIDIIRETPPPDEELRKLSNKNVIECINSDLFDDIDIVFIILHGKWGEDGTVQALLDLRGIKYTGSGVLASAIGIDKNMSKIVFRHHGVNTPDWFMCEKNSIDIDKVRSALEKRFGYPCVIKPNDQGSTVGLSIVNSPEDIEPAIELALKYSDYIMIEDYIEGRELTVGILEDTALPVIEIIPKGGIYDYYHKYTKGATEYIVPADIPDSWRESLQEQALTAFRSIGCKDFARVDFRVTDKGEIYCLEINTIPGMTGTSLVPKAAKAVGIQFHELVDRIVRSALKNRR
jgi:D-alanine-D-alanine ligase